MTRLDDSHCAAIKEAARWLAAGEFRGRGVVPTLRQKFGLSIAEVLQAIALAKRMRRAV